MTITERVQEAHWQMVRTANQVARTLETMEHLTNPHERTVATHLHQELEAAQEALAALKDFPNANTQMVAVVTASLTYASKAIQLFLEAWNADVLAAKHGNGYSSLVQ
jgi:glutamate/tyrosine decarboxylase-like PLP-dependent enzyme